MYIYIGDIYIGVKLQDAARWLLPLTCIYWCVRVCVCVCAENCAQTHRGMTSHTHRRLSGSLRRRAGKEAESFLGVINFSSRGITTQTRGRPRSRTSTCRTRTSLNTRSCQRTMGTTSFPPRILQKMDGS